MDLAINSKLRMNSGYEIPILGYGVGDPDPIPDPIPDRLVFILSRFTKCTQSPIARSSAYAYDFLKTCSRC
jgi:hypothetical protein